MKEKLQDLIKVKEHPEGKNKAEIAVEVLPEIGQETFMEEEKI